MKQEKQNKPFLKEYSSANIMNTVNTSAALNVISSTAEIAYSIRSSEPENEQELIKLIKRATENLNNKYEDLIRINVEIKSHLLPFVRNQDDFLTETIIKAAQKLNIKCFPSSFHAGAETHILANEKTNFYGEKFNPVIIGVADLQNIHSSNEKIDWQSFLSGKKWIEEIIIRFSENSLKRL